MQGSFPSFIYIPIHQKGVGVLRSLQAGLRLRNLRLAEPAEVPFHVSLSGPLNLCEYQIRPFLSKLTEAVKNEAFPFGLTIDFEKLEVLESENRKFLVVMCRRSAALEALFETLRMSYEEALGQPYPHDQYRPHITIGSWRAAEIADIEPEGLRTDFPKLNLIVSSITVRIGCKNYVLTLGDLEE